MGGEVCQFKLSASPIPMLSLKTVNLPNALLKPVRESKYRRNPYSPVISFFRKRAKAPRETVQLCGIALCVVVHKPPYVCSKSEGRGRVRGIGCYQSKNPARDWCHGH